MTQAASSFRDLNLPAPLLAALDKVGYETPSPIQAQAIPLLLSGRDLLGHAPTGTGKTAAFALPLLARLQRGNPRVQVLCLTPTRELAIQVAEAFQSYAAELDDFHVLPIYGGQDYSGQLRALRRGVQVVVGTPGRIMDHMRKGTLKLDGVQALVLDEADEMLRMGFLEEVQWILERTPAERQTMLFSATMPAEIQRIARRHLRDPESVSVTATKTSAARIRQRYWLVSGTHKLDALTRILEVEEFDGILLFVRTKIRTTELAERLQARGYAAAALNGDMPQNQREQMVSRLKSGGLDILVATDVAARGLDVDRISHVINYDIPNDTEAYVHRIGRTGRAGRTGDAILFVAPRERRMLGAIEKATGQKIEQFELPTTQAVNDRRIANFKQKISDTLATTELGFMRQLVEQYQQEHDVPALEIAAALAQMSVGDDTLLLKPEPPRRERKAATRQERETRPAREARKTEKSRRQPSSQSGIDFERYRIEVGHQHDVAPANIVGAIANEAGLDAEYIGRVEIFEDHSIVELPPGMPRDVFRDLRKTWICGQQLRIAPLEGKRASREQAPARDKAGKRGKVGGSPSKAGRSKLNGQASPAAKKKSRRK